ncbi:Disease resistance protein (TIR-NBS class) [Raphanus sativus]|nr:Disease resistance protein (TIR-NBS class) [Raphanus sativus]
MLLKASAILINTDPLFMLAPPSSLPRNRIHQVFPSFHGGDVRTNFLSHVLKDFTSKGIDLFIDSDIQRSKSIGPALIEAIRGSRIAIVLLSKNYASSTWCLNELFEIINYREEFGHTVIPIFYQVNPSDIKKQKSYFGKVFRKTCRGKRKEEIQRWKHALTVVAQIEGYHSANWFVLLIPTFSSIFLQHQPLIFFVAFKQQPSCIDKKTEAEMIENIATDVSNKLNFSVPCSDFNTLVGMESQMTRMGPLLQLDSDEVRKVGILGPSGIGKTTIARSLFNRHSQNFQLSLFMDNIKSKYARPACSDEYSVMLYLQEQLMSQLTKDKDIKIPHLGIAKDRLKDKKVLVVLDDVDWSVQLEAMAKDTSWFGPGSRIIITTQDETVLKASEIEHIHMMNLPSYDEALQIFCIYAFGHKDPRNGFRDLALEVMSLVGELPLGLRVMGSYFRGMSKQDWTEALAKLKIHLDRKGEFARRQIVREESINEPGKRQFLNDAKDIGEVLRDDKADNSSVIGISLELNDELEWTSERAFERFANLQFLRILGRGVNPESMKYISRKLRVLIWPNFQMSCFPSSFNPEFLVQVDMRFSGLKKLWKENKPLNNLKLMDLSMSQRLKELPDLSTATNLQELNLHACSSLVKLSSSIGNASNLQILNLSDCSRLLKLPSTIGNAFHLKKSESQGDIQEPDPRIGRISRLRRLVPSGLKKLGEHVSDGSVLKSYPESSTDIGELLDPWIERVSCLHRLVLSGMKKLVSIPQLRLSSEMSMKILNLQTLSLFVMMMAVKIMNVYTICTTKVNDSP